MADIYAIIGIVMLIFGILQIVLFFKLWGMTNDVRRLTEHFLKSDENENIYGVYDDEILLYGRNYNKLMNLLYRNEDKGKLSY